jgi:hypothetical protein
VKEQEGKAKSRNETEGKNGKVSRLWLAEVSLKRLWLRRRISAEFVEEVADWLSGADVTLFFARTTYAVVRTSVVENWPRVKSKRLSTDLIKVAQGSYDFRKLEHLLPAPKQGEEGGEGKDE